MSGPIRLATSHPIPLSEPRSYPLGGAPELPLSKAKAIALARNAQPLAKPDVNAQRAQLKHLSHQLEGVFLNQLFQAMRATVPHQDPSSSGEGEQLFTSMMDERLSQVAAERMTRGVGEALYHELARRLPPEGAQP